MHFLDQRVEVHKAGWNVAKFLRRYVPTSQRWVKKCRSQQEETSRCLNVVMYQRRDVATSSEYLYLPNQPKAALLKSQGILISRISDIQYNHANVGQTSLCK